MAHSPGGDEREQRRPYVELCERVRELHAMAERLIAQMDAVENGMKKHEGDLTPEERAGLLKLLRDIPCLSACSYTTNYAYGVPIYECMFCRRDNPLCS